MLVCDVYSKTCINSTITDISAIALVEVVIIRSKSYNRKVYLNLII